MRKPEWIDNKQPFKVLRKQIRLCLHHSHFRSIIFISRRCKKDIVFKYIKFLINLNWLAKRNIIRIKNNANESLLCFKNGSFIRIVPANQNVRGYRTHNVVIDSDIKNREIINCVIRPILRSLVILPPKWVMKLFGIKPYRVKRFKRNEYIVDI